MKKILLILTILGVAVLSAPAQVTGIFGKRFLVKADLARAVLNKGIGLEAEYAVFRAMTVSMGVATSNKAVYNNMLGRFGKDPKIGQIKDAGISFTIKYFSNEAFCAPRGGYFFFRPSFGRVKGTSNDNMPEYARANFKSSFLNLELGVGSQVLLKDSWMLDFGAGLTGMIARYPNGYWRDGEALRSGNLVLGQAVGVNIYVKVGRLIF